MGFFIVAFIIFAAAFYAAGYYLWSIPQQQLASNLSSRMREIRARNRERDTSS